VNYLDGKVWLVGAGPGDPGLLTLRGRDALATADAVVYDRLVNPAILRHLPPGCERIDAGKRPGRATMQQDEINALLVRLAREGKRVVRLKGGDPFVFGRGGEEASACHGAGIAVEVVPGVSSAIAVPAYAGIPVTHRGVAVSFTVLTGHEDPEKEEAQVDWQHVGRGTGTLVCLMGVHGLAEICRRLIEAGRSPSTPAAVIAQGTLPRQETVVGTLGTIADTVRAAGVQPPAVAVFGEVVGLRRSLEWFESRRLFGKRVLITRTREQASALRAGLEDEGAEVLELPTLEIVDRASPETLRPVLDALATGEFSLLVLTSENSVDLFFGCLAESGRDARALRDCRVAVVGPGTASALQCWGISADLMPDRHDGGALASLLAHEELAGRRVLVPRADAARPELVKRLRQQGAEVEEIPLYHSVVPQEPDPGILGRVREGEVDVATFASSSAVRNLVTMLGRDISGLRRATIACIGPLTAQTARQLGLQVDVIAAVHTIPGLIAAICEHAGRASSP
jgi:uroporphyrinogen III methyltransferase/synthase